LIEKEKMETCQNDAREQKQARKTGELNAVLRTKQDSNRRKQVRCEKQRGETSLLFQVDFIDFRRCLEIPLESNSNGLPIP